ncbi:MAG TPA: RNA polymerase sigma factor [Solirubrobacteraceae bacterium]|nr:RNA polymerase sigma factor [Solirubrobacteraceae bacterium]
MGAQGHDDAALIHAAQSEPAVFGTIFDRHFGAVYGFCARRVGGELADDLAGETFRRAFEARGSYDLSQPNALPWLFRIALNLMRDVIRSRAAEDRAYARLRAFAGTGSVSEEDPTVRGAEARADLARLAQVLVTERREDVEALFLHVWEGLSYLEVATALGVPIGTVRSRLSRLRDRIEAALGNQASKPQAIPLETED